MSAHEELAAAPPETIALGKRLAEIDAELHIMYGAFHALIRDRLGSEGYRNANNMSQAIAAKHQDREDVKQLWLALQED